MITSYKVTLRSNYSAWVPIPGDMTRQEAEQAIRQKYAELGLEVADIELREEPIETYHYRKPKMK